MEITGALQHYAWGKLGKDSLVAKLASYSSSGGAPIDQEKPYAELWMGTHPNGPSKLAKSQTLLSDLIKEKPLLLLGSNKGQDLPFLFKVLSVNKALSIQAHPNKEWAEKLHAERPDVYKDPNHKPEMAIALTPFDALCGFRPLEDIKTALKSIPQLREAAGQKESSRLLEGIFETEANLEAALRDCFVGLMKCPKDRLAQCLDGLRAEIEEAGQGGHHDDYEELFLELLKDYPGDVGCLAALFLNRVRLEPGEAVFLGANVPHAYLKGDCVECMACSDNVVRAGLTPKMIDVDTLCAILEYRCAKGDPKFKSRPEGPHSTLYDPPVKDFSVARLEALGLDPVRFPVRDGASIIIVVEGQGTYSSSMQDDEEVHGNLGPGTILFLPAGQTLEAKVADPKVAVVAYQAFC